MSLSPVRRRKGSDPCHNQIKHIDGHKEVSGHVEVKARAHSKAGTHGKKKTRAKSFSDEHIIVHTKSETKKQNTTNAQTKTTRTGEDSPGHTKKKSHAIASTPDNHSSNKKLPTNSDGKATKHVTHTKDSTHGAHDNSNTHKSESSKRNKMKKIGTSIDKESDTGTIGLFLNQIVFSYIRNVKEKELWNFIGYDSIVVSGAIVLGIYFLLRFA